MGQKLGHQTGAIPFDPHQNMDDAVDEAVEDKGGHVGRKQFSLYRAVHKGGVLTDVPGDTKEQIIRATMKRIASSLNLDAEVITELLLDREKLQPTALNNGIGIPHTRDCILKPGQNVVAVVFPKSPIPYGALDGEPVHTLFFLFASEDKRHLHLLAKIAHLSSQAETIKLLRTKPSKNQLLDYIRDWEASIQKVEA
jgi:PTS system nitrogen regulatory IIA component